MGGQVQRRERRGPEDWGRGVKHLRFYDVLRTMNPNQMPYWGKMPSDIALKRLWALSIAPRRKKLTGWYGEYLSSIGWRERRAVVLILSMYSCARCGRRAHQVHHRTYDRVKQEWLIDLEPLCRGCHSKHHGIVTTKNHSIMDEVWKLIDVIEVRRKMNNTKSKARKATEREV